MGYWEQIGEANRRYRERRARMTPRQRAIRDAVGSALLVAAAMVFWALMLAPILLGALHGFSQ